MTPFLRSDRVVIRLSGSDAYKLLNDVVTGRMPLAGDAAAAAWWALLSPQGKVLVEGRAGWADDAYWLDVHQSVADDFGKRMRMYRLRADVVIEDLRDSHRVGFALAPLVSGIAHTLAFADPSPVSWRVIAPAAAAQAWADDEAPFLQHRIAAGVPELGTDFLAGEMFAHDLGMDLLDGIDFAKGCYVGQEVVSRMKHRGTARRRPVIVSGVEAPAGTTVTVDGRDAGTIGSSLNGQAVAIVRLDRFTAGATASVAGQPVGVALPSWAPYRLGDAVPDEA